MTDIVELKIVLMRKGMTAEQLADLIGMSRASLSYKMNNKREFSQTEIYQIRMKLGLTMDEVDKIFFADKVDEKSTEV